MKRLFVLFIAMVVISANSIGATLHEDPVTILQSALTQLAHEPNYILILQTKIHEPKKQFSGQLNLSFSKHENQGSALVRAFLEMQGIQLNAEGAAKFLDNSIYFNLKQSSLGKREVMGEWFALDTQPFLKLNPRMSLEQQQMAQDLLKKFQGQLLTSFGKVQQKNDEIIGGLRCRHLTLSFDLERFFDSILEALPETEKKIKGVAPITAIPPVQLDFWITRANNQLQQIEVPFQKQGKMNLTVHYHPNFSAEEFVAPQDTIDARVLGVTATYPLPSLLPQTIKPAQKLSVSPIAGTTIYLTTLAPYNGPKLEDIRSFLETKFGLQNLEIVPSIPIPDTAFDSIRFQYAGEEVLQNVVKTNADKKLDDSNHFLIAITDKDMYLKQSPELTSAIYYGAGNAALLSTMRLKSDLKRTTSRLEKLVLRTLGQLYWKLPPTSLPHDLMFDSGIRMPDLDLMGTSFLEDLSLPLYAQAKTQHEAGHDNQALSLLKQALEYNPLSYNAYLLLSQINIQLGHYNDAITPLNSALLIHPDDDRGYLLLGQCYEKLDNLVLALREYRGAFFLNPTRNVSLQLSALYQRLGQEAKAERYANKAKELNK